MVSAASVGCGTAEAGAGAGGGRSEDDGTGGGGVDSTGSPGAMGNTYVGGSIASGWDASTAGCGKTGGSAGGATCGAGAEDAGTSATVMGGTGAGGGKIADDGEGAAESEGAGADSESSGSESVGAGVVGAATKPQLGQVPAPFSSARKPRPHRAHCICCTRKLDFLHCHTATLPHPVGDERRRNDTWAMLADCLSSVKRDGWARRRGWAHMQHAGALRSGCALWPVACGMAARRAPAPEQNQVYT